MSKIMKDCGEKLTIDKYFDKPIDILKSDDDKFTFHAHELLRKSKKSLIDLKSPQESLIQMFKYSKLSMLLEYKIPFEKYADDVGATALHLAAAFGRNDLIIWLYINKFNVNALDKLGLFCVTLRSTQWEYIINFDIEYSWLQ